MRWWFAIWLDLIERIKMILLINLIINFSIDQNGISFETRRYYSLKRLAITRSGHSVPWRASNHMKVSFAPFVCIENGECLIVTLQSAILIHAGFPQGNIQVYRGAVNYKIKFRNNKTRKWGRNRLDSEPLSIPPEREEFIYIRRRVYRAQQRDYMVGIKSSSLFFRVRKA